MAKKTFLRPFCSKRLLRRRANNKLSGETVERPLGIPKGDACHSKNHGGVTPVQPE